MTRREPSARVSLTLDDVRILGELAHFYDKSVGPVRLLVRGTSSAEMRGKFRFVAEESRVLAALARSLEREMTEAGDEKREVNFLVPALVAYWGRVLSSLDSKRARRKLSEEQIEAREQLGRKLEEAARKMTKRDRALLEREIGTRRPVEGTWMRERLGLATTE